MAATRRDFLGSLAGTAASFGAAERLFGADNHERMTLSAPLTHSDWMLKPNIEWGEPGIRHMLDACQACGWSHVYWRVFDAGRSTYRSQLLAPAGKADADSFYSPQTDADREIMRKFCGGTTPERAAQITAQVAAMDYANFDTLSAAVDYGHAIGLKIHVWATINEDDHGWGWSSKFAKAHPEFRWVRRDGRTYQSQLSFAFPEVRAYKLALIEELLAYDVDGLFIDWIRTGDVRDNPQTDPAGVADSGYETPNIDAFRTLHGADPHDVPNGDDRWVRVRAEPQTDFMRELRKLAAAGARPPPIAVMVGHPWHYRGLLDPIDGNLRGLLLDVATWATEGLIDAAVAAGYYRTGGSAEAAYRALAEETGGKVDLWYYAWVPQTPAEFDQQFAEAQKMAARRMLFWEADYMDDRPQAAALKAAMSAKALR